MTSTTGSPIYTNEEAVRWLRLDEDYEELGDAISALHRIVQKRKLNPLKCGPTYKFTLAELLRFSIEEVRRPTS